MGIGIGFLYRICSPGSSRGHLAGRGLTVSIRCYLEGVSIYAHVCTVSFILFYDSDVLSIQTGALKLKIMFCRIRYHKKIRKAKSYFENVMFCFIQV